MRLTESPIKARQQQPAYYQKQPAPHRLRKLHSALPEFVRLLPSN